MIKLNVTLKIHEDYLDVLRDAREWQHDNRYEYDNEEELMADYLLTVATKFDYLEEPEVEEI